MKDRLVITEEIAERIISSRVLIEEPMVPYKGVEVTSVTYNDAEGNAFVWEESEEPYAIVNFKACNQHLLEKAVEDFEAGDFEASTNHNLSMRMNIDKAREVQNVGSGTLVCHEVEVEDNDGNPTKALLAKSFQPAVAVTAKKVSLKDMLARKAEKAVAENVKLAGVTE